MNGNNIFLDTNIVLYLIGGDETLAELLNNKRVYISFITELELLGYMDITNEELQKVEEFLTAITIIDINSEIKKITNEIRRNYKVKLPDAIICATAYNMNLPLMTADKNLSKLTEINILQYEQ